MKKHPNQELKRKQIKQHLKVHWEMSNRAVGRSLGVHHSTVQSVRDEMEQSGRFIHLSTSNNCNKWLEHPYLKLDENKGLLENLTPRGLRAIKRVEVLDYMMANKTIKSPLVAQAKLAKDAIIRRKTAPYELSKDDVDIRVADVCELDQLDFISNGSITACICDPPWNSSSPAVCAGIANAAASKLKDGGSLLVLTGSTHLDEVITALSANKTIKYHWLLACPLPQGTPASTSWLRVQSKVRIILWFVKGKYCGDIVSDFIDRPTLGNSQAKEHHEWGAPKELISELITRFSDPGDCIADFTVGGGTVPYCATLLGRRCFGSDVNPDAVRITNKRVRELFGYTR